MFNFMPCCYSASGLAPGTGSRHSSSENWHHTTTLAREIKPHDESCHVVSPLLEAGLHHSEENTTQEYLKFNQSLYTVLSAQAKVKATQT